MPLSENVYGIIDFVPGDIASIGSNVTINCTGKDAKIPRLNPRLSRIERIVMMDNSIRKEIHKCKFAVGNDPECLHNITVKTLGKLSFSCRFLSGITGLGCFASQNLTVTKYEGNFFTLQCLSLAKMDQFKINQWKINALKSRAVFSSCVLSQ